MSFKRTIEDFRCEHCNFDVIGSGYTNHCPRCLWSKHVDVSPGDRAATCMGMMEPIALEGSSPSYTIVHHCTRCGYEHRNKVDPRDDVKTLLVLAGLTGEST